MGFFQELKDNLSIAVSELIPDDDVLIKGIKKEDTSLYLLYNL